MGDNPGSRRDGPREKDGRKGGETAQRTLTTKERKVLWIREGVTDGSAAARAILERMKEHPEEENAILDEAEAEALKDDSCQQYILKEEKGNDH